jgi:hypothetical protein
MDLDLGSLTGAFERILCALAPIFVAFDRSDNELLNGCVVFMIWCLDEVDMELDGSCDAGGA